MENYLKTQILLHQELNNENTKDEDIDRKYKQMRIDYKKIVNFTNNFFTKENIFIYSHDGTLIKLKYNDKGQLKINFNAIVYNNETKQKIGKQVFSLIVNVNEIKKLNSKKNDIIFNLSISDNEIGLITLDENWNSFYDVIKYSKLELKPIGFIEKTKKIKI